MCVILRSLWAACCLLLCHVFLFGSCALADDVNDHYPKLALYTRQVGEMTDAQLDTLARYDLVGFSESPPVIAKVRQRKPGIDLFFLWMPQNIVSWSESQTFWYPDTTWSLIRLCQLYAIKNDWYLRDINGNRIPEWGGWAANWTRYCPKGTYGTSRGLNYVEWLTQVALPQITGGNLPSARWGWNSSLYQGLVFEGLVDCVGSWGWQTYQYADPDRDGEAEGVYHTCSLGGDRDSLSILYREMNEVFHDHLWAAVGNDLPLVLNAGNRFMNPSWWTDLSGIKIESWYGPPSQEWQEWRDWFYGLRDWSGDDLWGPGYRWSEWFVHHNNDDLHEGWDLSLLQVRYQESDPPSKIERRKRIGLGTTLLGDGYFMFTKDEWELAWQPEYDLDLGASLGAFARETYQGETPADTLYVRVFSKGVVEVNPNTVTLRDIPADDARISFWRTVTDLAVVQTGSQRVRAWFQAPSYDPNPVDQFEVRYSRNPITPGNWHNATPYAGNPLEVPPGGTAYANISGLIPNTTYYVAVRNWVNGRLDPNLSNVVSASTAVNDNDDPPVEVDVAEPSEPSLECWPVPSRGKVELSLRLDAPTQGRLEVLDARGRRVRLLRAENALGSSRISFDGMDDRGTLLANGIYWVHFEGRETTLTRRIVIAR